MILILHIQYGKNPISLIPLNRDAIKRGDMNDICPSAWCTCSPMFVWIFWVLWFLPPPKNMLVDGLAVFRCP